MSKTTPNYGFIKPELNDVADITLPNENWDKLDTELKKKYDADNKPTVEDIGAAPSTHNHSASDITSGTLPITRGGTGATSASQALTKLGAAPAYTYSTTDLTAGTSDLATGKLYIVYE